MTIDFIPFADLDGISVSILLLIYFLAFFIRGVLGFGSAMPAVLGSVWVLPAHDAVLLALLTSVFAQIQLLKAGEAVEYASWESVELVAVQTQRLKVCEVGEAAS